MISNTNNVNFFVYLIFFHTSINKIEYIDFKNANYADLNDCIAHTDWCSIYCSDFNESIRNFYEILNSIISRLVPRKSFNPNSYKFKYCNPDLRRLVKLKNRAHYVWRCSGKNSDYEIFSSYRAGCKSLMNMCSRDMKCDIESRLRSDPKYFWTYFNSRRKDHNLPNTFNYGDAQTSDHSVAANYFNDYFLSVFNRPRKSFSLDSRSDYGPVPPHSDISVSLLDVRQALQRAKSLRSPGPDGIPVFPKKLLGFSLYSSPVHRFSFTGCGLCPPNLEGLIHHTSL